jgi:hypothetical protein
MTVLPNKPIEKQPYEEFFIAGSILKVQTATETVVVGNSNVSAVDKDNADVSSTFLDDATKVVGNDPDGDYTNNILSIRVRAGEVALSPYKVTFQMETTEGNKWEVDRMVDVIET